MAEREGFEPSVPLVTAHTISSRAPSASSDISPLALIIPRINNMLALLSAGITPKQVLHPGYGGRGEIRTRGGQDPQ